MDDLLRYLPVLLPFIIVELILAITALVNVLKHSNYKFGNKVFWIIIVLFIQIIGPVIYFIFGKDEERDE